MKRTLFALACTTSLALAQPALRTLKIQESPPPPKNRPGYSIQVEYPGPNAAALKWVQAQIQEFKKEYREYALEPRPDLKCTLDIGFEVVYQSPRLTAIEFSTAVYYGGAHPGHNLAALLLDGKGKPLSLSRCFKPQSDWIGVLADYCKQDLIRQKIETSDDFLNDGTAAKPENYKVVLPTKDGLRVEFPEYQVAPYSSGPQQVLVPYSQIKELIDPAGPLGERR